MYSHTRTPTTPTAPQTLGQTPTLQIKTHVKAGGVHLNHNETLVQPQGLRVKKTRQGGEPRSEPQPDSGAGTVAAQTGYATICGGTTAAYPGGVRDRGADALLHAPGAGLCAQRRARHHGLACDMSERSWLETCPGQCTGTGTSP